MRSIKEDTLRLLKEYVRLYNNSRNREDGEYFLGRLEGAVNVLNAESEYNLVSYKTDDNGRIISLKAIVEKEVGFGEDD